MVKVMGLEGRREVVEVVVRGLMMVVTITIAKVKVSLEEGELEPKETTEACSRGLAIWILMIGLLVVLGVEYFTLRYKGCSAF